MSRRTPKRDMSKVDPTGIEASLAPRTHHKRQWCKECQKFSSRTRDAVLGLCYARGRVINAMDLICDLFRRR